MAGTQHTQTHPKFIYTFLAVHRDCIADGKNTVHVAADTLVDACEMLNDMGYISATWKGREENTLFIQKCENNFIWRFIALSTAQPRVIHIEATSEQEARQQSPAGCVMVFARRWSMCNATWPDAAVDAIKTLMDSLIEISAIAGVAHKHAARESECISHYLAFVQLKADQALDKAGKIIMADVQEVHHA
ncbi:TPA: host cell division inhibitor Icd-like protein [Escherichia coli]|nr:host cell division inhibitor Icd-like protein [Escherichia coli]HAY0409570.1 host cell division inhibitor Icd-like protein [Escherichia coli]